MRRLVAIVAFLLVLVPFVHADSSDEQYVEIYNLIQEGDSLSATQPRQALEKYNQAQTELRRFQRVYPGWNDRIVNFRLDYLASKITILSANAAGISNAPAPVASSPAQPEPATTSAPPAVVQAPIPSPAQAPVPAPAPVVSAPPQPSPEVSGLQNQISDLQNQLKQLLGEKSLLEAKLREALAARPAAADPRAFAEAQRKLRTVEKENELLQVSLAQEKEKVASLANTTELEKTKLELADAKRQLVEQTARATQLAQQNESLQAQITTLTANTAELAELRSENAALKKTSKPAAASSGNADDLRQQLVKAQATIAALQADKDVWNLEKAALQNRVKQLSQVPAGPAPSTQVWTENTQHVKQLERERDELQKKLDAAQRELYGRNGKATAARVDELANELETLRARLGIYESKPVPYTAEELALFKRPDTVANPHEGEKSARELPAGTVQLVAEAQQDFSARSYEAAEKKYLEVLKHDDKNVNTLGNLATIQLEMSHFDDAEKNLKTALSIAPDDAFCLSILGNLKFRQGKYDEALDALSRAAKADPQNAEIQNFLGLTLSQKGMRKAAETAFRKAIMLNPNYAGAQNNLAVFYLTEQPPELALARWHYEKAIAAGFPHNPELEKMLDEKKTASEQ